MSEERKTRDHDWREENDPAFRAFAREEGFRMRGSWAWRRREGAQDGLHMFRSKTGLGEQSVRLLLRLNRPGDRGGEVLRSHDVEATVYSLFARGGGLENDQAHALYIAATRVGSIPPEGGRGPALRRLLDAALPWFEAIGSEEALGRYVAAGEGKTHMGLVTRAFFEDYVWKAP